MSSMRIPQERIERDFAKHKATILIDQKLSDDTNLTIINFSTPGTGIGHMRFTINSNYLTVQGDYGSAVYRWSSPVGISFLADCSFDYFMGKCEASEGGRDFEEWDDHSVMSFIGGHLKEMAEENDVMDTYNEHLQRIEASRFSMHEWREGLESIPYKDMEKLLGNEWYEYLDVGMVPSIRAELHWHGIKRAAESLRVTA